MSETVTTTSSTTITTTSTTTSTTPLSSSGSSTSSNGKRFKYARKTNESERPQRLRSPGGVKKPNNNNKRIYHNDNDNAFQNKATTTTTTLVSTANTTTNTKNSEDNSGGEEDVCIICCDPIKVYALGICNHKDVCSNCTLRLRALYKENDCCICKTPLKSVIFTVTSDKDWEDFDLKSLIFDPKQSVYFESDDYRKQIDKLWEYKCTVCDHPPLNSVQSLRKHLLSVHNLTFCDLCLTHRKVFLNEQELFPPRELGKHNSEWDGGSGAEQKQKGHPICEFCQTNYYGMDHLYEHLTKIHETCFICDKNGVRFQYYKDYPNLEKHYGTDHFLCTERECLEQKFVVFSTAIDLKAHEVKVHLPQRNASKSAKEQMRRIETNFTIRREEEPSRRYGRHNNNHGENGGSNNSSSYNNTNNNNNNNYNDDENLARALSASEISFRSANGPPPITPPPSSATSQQSSRAPQSFSPGFIPSLASAEPSETYKKTLQEKNKQLIREMRAALDSERDFEDFKRISAQFRNDQLPALEYYKLFMETFGDEKGSIILPTLIELLPDTNKRDALSRIHEQISRLNTLYPKLASKSKEKNLEKKLNSVWDNKSSRVNKKPIGSISQSRPMTSSTTTTTTSTSYHVEKEKPVTLYECDICGYSIPMKEKSKHMKLHNIDNNTYYAPFSSSSSTPSNIATVPQTFTTTHSTAPLPSKSDFPSLSTTTTITTKKGKGVGFSQSDFPSLATSKSYSESVKHADYFEDSKWGNSNGYDPQLQFDDREPAKKGKKRGKVLLHFG